MLLAWTWDAYRVMQSLLFISWAFNPLLMKSAETLGRSQGLLGQALIRYNGKKEM